MDRTEQEAEGEGEGVSLFSADDEIRFQNDEGTREADEAFLAYLDRHYAEPDDDEGEADLGGCPYYALYRRLPGHDPNAICGSGCVDEPACVTCEPTEGWPSRKGDAHA